MSYLHQTIESVLKSLNNALQGRTYYYNKAMNKTAWDLETDEQRAALAPPLDPYNNPLVMPLAEFVEHPMAQVRVALWHLFQRSRLGELHVKRSQVGEILLAMPLAEFEEHPIAQARAMR